MDIYSPVKALASSSYETSSGLRFAPQLAIQVDTSFVWANCFISRKEPQPWFSLEFKTMISIFNVRLGVRDQPSGQLPADFNLTGMARLHVYVSNSSIYKGSDETLCGIPWTYEDTKIIDVNCGTKLRGKFVFVMVPSSLPTYLMICSIVFNRDDGTVSRIVIADVIQRTDGHIRLLLTCMDQSLNYDLH